MNEAKRIFSDRRRLTAFLCIPLVCIALFFYQKCDGNFGELTAQAREYRSLIAQYKDSSLNEIIDTFDSHCKTDSEIRLLEQAKYLVDYVSYLERVQEQAKKLQLTSLFGGDPNSFTYQNILKTAEDFSGCTAEGLRLGNDRSVHDWLSFEGADWLFLVAILFLVIAFIEERQKGLVAIIRTCPAGRGKLQVSRLLLLLCYCAGMTLLLYYLPLLLSLCLDGGWGDLARPVQALEGFQKCTVQMSIGQFLLRFFFVKTACGFLLGVLIWFLLSFLEQVQLCWLMTSLGLAIEYLLYTFIPAQSLFSPLRYVNVFSYVFTSQLYTQYVNINFFSFPVGQRTLLLALLMAVALILSVAIVWVLIKRYPFGNRDWMGKWIHLLNRVGDVIRRHLGLYGFEWYKLLFLSAGGLFLVLGILLTRDIRCNSGAYNSLEDVVYRQYVAVIQGPVTQNTFSYIEEARQSLKLSALDTAEFEIALNRLEQTISDLEEGAWVVDETTFLNIYGSDAWRLQRKNGLFALIFLVACLSPLYACEQNGDVKKILRSTPGGRNKLFWTKYAVACSVTVLVWLLVFGREWLTAAEMLGGTILAAPCSSIGILKRFPMSVGTFLVLLYVSKGLCLLIPMHLCIFIGERSSGFEKAFLLSAVVLLLPAAAYAFGADALRVLTSLPLLSDGNLLLSGVIAAPIFAFFGGLSIAMLLLTRHHWCRPA